MNTQQDDTTFSLAFLAIGQVMDDLDQGYFYRDTEGEALFTLDQVMVAIDEERWPVEANGA